MNLLAAERWRKGTDELGALTISEVLSCLIFIKRRFKILLPPEQISRTATSSNYARKTACRNSSMISPFSTEAKKSCAASINILASKSPRGLRVAVGTIVGLVATDHSKEEILAMYPYLKIEDIHQAITSPYKAFSFLP